MIEAVTVTPTRFVTIRLYVAISGPTGKSIRRKMERGVWLEGKQWRRADGVIYIDTKETERWVETAAG